MATKDIFDKPFDEGTQIKLEIFQKYLETWLPTFIMGSFSKPIQVFDLFAGSGYDKSGVPGSPMRILEVINNHRGNLVKTSKKVKLYFNDSCNEKVEKLKLNVDAKIKALSLSSFVEVTYSNDKFNECLSIHYKEILKNGCNLIFIDQNGFKEVDEKTFQFLINLATTDFMFFISSSYIHRFAILEEVQKVHPKFDFEKIKNTSRKKVHNVICEEYEKYVPVNIESYGLFPFSIMKDDHNNVYGLIFVTKHIRGADKFLETVWKKNALNGTANFDIDEDLKKSQLDLFDGKIPTKIESFQRRLCEKILKQEIINNRDAYLYTLNQGHISAHADEVIRNMRKKKLISYDNRSPLVNYKMAIKKKQILEYKLVKNETNKN